MRRGVIGVVLLVLLMWICAPAIILGILGTAIHYGTKEDLPEKEPVTAEEYKKRAELLEAAQQELRKYDEENP